MYVGMLLHIVDAVSSYHDDCELCFSKILPNSGSVHPVAVHHEVRRSSPWHALVECPNNPNLVPSSCWSTPHWALLVLGSVRHWPWSLSVMQCPPQKALDQEGPR
jgi:hypothetical protein